MQTIEQNNQTLPVFVNWFNYMSQFKLEFEIRRIVFGLCSILRTPSGSLPELIQQKLPDITKQLGILSDKVTGQRMKILIANEKFVEKGGASSDDEDLGSDDEDGNFDDEDDENAEEEATMNKLKNFKNGKPDIKDNISDSDDDSDYEENAGEFALYDSPLEKTDELLFLKETLETIHNVD